MHKLSHQTYASGQIAHSRVRVVAPWSCFLGCEGEAVEWFAEYAMVLLEGERRALRFGHDAIEVLPC